MARDDLDAVLVLTAMPSHGEIAAAALDAGKHVLVEKPMSVHLDEAAGLVAKAAAGPGLLVCASHVVLSPTYRALWKRIDDDGEIGTVLTARPATAGPDRLGGDGITTPAAGRCTIWASTTSPRSLG